MERELIDDIYGTLIGVMKPEYRVAGVENAFAPGEYCAQMYEQMLEHRERLWQRLGTTEDEDLEGIISCMESIQEALAVKMFEYGGQFAE